MGRKVQRDKNGRDRFPLLKESRRIEVEVMGIDRGGKNRLNEMLPAESEMYVRTYVRSLFLAGDVFPGSALS